MSYQNKPVSQARDYAPEISVHNIKFGDTDTLNAEIYAGIPEEKAKFIAEYSSKEANKPTQLRRFYDELCLWHEKVNLGGTQADKKQRYEELAPLIKMLKAKVAYAEGRKHVDKNFNKLFSHCIGEIKDAKTLAQCKLFFEAFMGFYKAARPSN